jgi:NAD(P)-dependent dehydrogenase (short-subunit alcohol dehydrogenase family)
MGDGLKGQVALVTGASRGIGRAIALELACRGAAVAVNYRARQTEAEAVARRILDMGRPCILVQGDVAVSAEARRVVGRVLDEWGRLDILVNNAGITRDRSLRKLAGEEWVDVINVNLNGTFYCTSAAIDRMIGQKHGHIINISSLDGQMAASGHANHSVGKGGVVAFTKTLALELAKYGITANALAPGYTATEMFDALPENLKDQIKARIPAGRFCKPEEVACAVAFLATEGDYITGQQIGINGGLCM